MLHANPWVLRSSRRTTERGKPQRGTGVSRGTTERGKPEGDRGKPEGDRGNRDVSEQFIALCGIIAALSASNWRMK
jgi:hypothetical protein